MADYIPCWIAPGGRALTIEGFSGHNGDPKRT
jgi:hypothetical protein